MSTPPPAKNQGFGMQRRLSRAKISEFSIIDRFKFGYRNREDKTNLPAGVLVKGSSNVLTNVSERIQARNGYVLDGPTSSTIVPIDSGYTFLPSRSGEQNLRTYLPSANNGVVEYRYVDNTGLVTWRTLISGLSNTSFNFTS